MLTLHIEALTHEELVRQAVAALGIQTRPATESGAPSTPSVTHPIVAPAVPSEAAQTEPKRRGRPPKAAPAPSEAAQPAQEAAPSEPSVVEVPTHEQAIDAQKALYDAKGAEACIVVLQRHGANRISEIKPEQRARFIQDCNDALAGKDLSAAA